MAEAPAHRIIHFRIVIRRNSLCKVCGNGEGGVIVRGADPDIEEVRLVALQLSGCIVQRVHVSHKILVRVDLKVMAVHLKRSAPVTLPSATVKPFSSVMSATP